jgi:hypothetical protein
MLLIIYQHLPLMIKSIVFPDEKKQIESIICPKHQTATYESF